MLRLSDTALWRAGRRWAWAGGFGLLLSGTTSAMAQDCAPVCAAPGCDPACAAPSGAACDPGCYAPAGCTTDYNSLTECATGCGSVLGCCDDGCDGCDTGCCNLGAPWALADCLDLSCLDLGGCLHDDSCDTVCDSGCVGGCDGACGAGAAAAGPVIGGWVQFGYHDGSTGQFNNRPHEFANHQSWVFIEDVADGSNGLDFGYRADFMYGLDADDTQAFGNPPGTYDFDNGWDHGAYGFALPQLYAEAAYGDFSVIAGHFYTLLGYEVVTAPDNFFYSHAFTMYNAEAFTHTGVLTTYAASDDVTLYNGYTFGWDTGFEQFDRPNGGEGSNYLGGASVALTDNLTVTYITTAGDLGAIGDGYSHSIVADWQINDSWNYVFQSDYLDVENSSTLPDNFVGTPNETDFTTDVTRFYGINQYLFYTINDCWAVGGRAEWFNTGEADIYELTGGVNYRPTANLVIRPEYRYQFEGSDGALNNFFGGDVEEGGIFGVDAILTF
ncbi:outer membrane beta-barrel protein [Alienimonas sp. DA493]|uniref:outer membrane beta-barrel protein n=1 Tax=Alienimonas sp. DA493 TaxID=3373605 RepID=UPI0037543114